MPRVALLAAMLAALAGCAAQSPPQRVNGGHSLPPAPQQAQKPAFAGEPGEAVWHLRAGLNVAALVCKGRGRTSVAGHYARVLTRHKALLADAYGGEVRRYGKGLDRHQTQLYNRFSNQRDPVRFCTEAAGVAREAGAMDSPTLTRSARSLLGRID